MQLASFFVKVQATRPLTEFNRHGRFMERSSNVLLEPQ